MVYYDYAASWIQHKTFNLVMCITCFLVLMLSHTLFIVLCGWILYLTYFFYDIIALEIVLYSYLNFTCQYVWNDTEILLATDLCEQSYF
jgi:hypothetical protein